MSCSFPQAPLSHQGYQASHHNFNDYIKLEGQKHFHKVTRIALVADPQLTEPYSYGHSGLLETIVEYYSDQYMAKSFRLLQWWLDPEAVFFLGDLFDGGREHEEM